MTVEVGAFSSIIYWLSNLNEGDSGGRFGYFIFMCFLHYWVRQPFSVPRSRPSADQFLALAHNRPCARWRE